MSDISSATVVDFRSALDEFETAWENPNHTRFTLPAVDVNSVLAKKYITSAPVKITRDMVWDMELQKAWDPATFIPYVVSEGKSWGRGNSMTAANTSSGRPSNWGGSPKAVVPYLRKSSSITRVKEFCFLAASQCETTAES